MTESSTLMQRVWQRPQLWRPMSYKLKKCALVLDVELLAQKHLQHTCCIEQQQADTVLCHFLFFFKKAHPRIAICGHLLSWWLACWCLASKAMPKTHLFEGSILRIVELCCGGSGDPEAKVAGDEERERLARLRHVVIVWRLHFNAQAATTARMLGACRHTRGNHFSDLQPRTFEGGQRVITLINICHATHVTDSRLRPSLSLFLSLSAHTHTHIHKQMHIRTLSLVLCHCLSLSLFFSMHAHAHTQTNTRTHTHTRAHTHTHAHTNTCTHTHAHAHNFCK